MGMIFMMMAMILLSFMEFFLLFQHFFCFAYMYMLGSSCMSFYSKISYSLGFDFFSYGLVLMGFLISSFMLISMHGCVGFFMYLSISAFITFLVILIFCSLNFLYMYISFELILVPLLILVLGWGYQPERLIAGMYLFFYTVIFSLPLLVFLLIFYLENYSLIFDNMKLYTDFFVIHFIMVVVFMVKLPMYFLHFWLPKAHVQAPVSGSMILAGLMLSIGGFGLIRVMNVCECMFIKYSYIWYSFSMVGSLLISIVCLIQADMKCLIAYSSVSHMGMVIMGLVTVSNWGVLGSYMLMLGHGFCSSGLFYLANLFYTRSGSRSFYINKGLMTYIPSCSLIFFLLCSFNMSCPPSVNFISELMILNSMMMFWPGSFIFFVGISFFCACFSYYLFSYSQHGLNHNIYTFSNINLIEFLCLFLHLIPLIFLPVMILTFM
uniref:NADH-ubiquinone oxidoreductase chain 4 n=1 Tax=Abrus expansivus TaxID=2664682 RepID=A0A5Q0RZY3_9HEMI|nr:NADH dehydrogenase subunit 4 [Abrus expansivus]QGA47525.1 NADH dehydrogenase subunit 4 [Abrus expansivus]